ncbi:hypothetical protein PQR67_03450 [Paraburkholderia fungorum]|uniref:hypothetical protein n=1 Tax=Paraburkholderia fungorum TaxID=134537 RepID=UPI0038B816F2
MRSVHAGRVGTAIKVYPDGSAAVAWDDGVPQPEGLAHERMPRALLELLGQSGPDRAEQAASVSKIVADGLRAAVLAPDLASALDAAGGALIDIANLASGDRPSTHGQYAYESFCDARDAADQTMRVLDRVSYLFEAIARLACDADGAIEDLASVGRELADAETDRIDRVFTRLAHQTIAGEVQS